MRKITRGATAFALSTTMTWLLGGCCDPGPPPPSGPDMTPPPSGPDMASLPPTDEACDVGRSSAGCARRILAGAWKVHGLTHDGHALVSDDAGALSAVRLADGHVERLRDHFLRLWVLGDIAVIFHDQNPDHQSLSAVDVWSPSTGLRPLDASAQQYSLARMQTDGRHLAWVGNITSDGTHGDVLLGSIDSDAAPMTLLSQIALREPCYPRLRMLGERLVVAACGPDDLTASVTSFTLDDGVATTLLSPAQAMLESTRDRSRILVASPAGDTQLMAPDGSAATPFVSGFVYGHFVPDGSAIVYRDAGGAVWRAPVDGTAANEVLAPGAEFFNEVSNDGHFVWYSTMQGDVGTGDAYVTTLTEPTTPITLSAKTDVANNGEAFTNDSAFALYLAEADNDDWVGTLWALSTARGARRMLGERAYVWWPLEGARLVFADQFGDGHVDLEWIDIAKEEPATRLVAKAQIDYIVSDDNRTLLFAGSGDAAGVYTLPLP